MYCESSWESSKTHALSSNRSQQILWSMSFLTHKLAGDSVKHKHPEKAANTHHLRSPRSQVTEAWWWCASLRRTFPEVPDPYRRSASRSRRRCRRCACECDYNRERAFQALWDIWCGWMDIKNKPTWNRTASRPAECHYSGSGRSRRPPPSWSRRGVNGTCWFERRHLGSKHPAAERQSGGWRRQGWDQLQSRPQAFETKNSSFIKCREILCLFIWPEINIRINNELFKHIRGGHLFSMTAWSIFQMKQVHVCICFIDYLSY